MQDPIIKVQIISAWNNKSLQLLEWEGDLIFGGKSPEECDTNPHCYLHEFDLKLSDGIDAGKFSISRRKSARERDKVIYFGTHVGHKGRVDKSDHEGGAERFTAINIVGDVYALKSNYKDPETGEIQEKYLSIDVEHNLFIVRDAKIDKHLDLTEFFRIRLI
ncbi:hypothetical protein ACPCHU_27530 [Bacillus bombysepticus]